MRKTPAVSLAALLVVASSAVATAQIAYDHPEYLKAATTILCDCGCHPQSVHECACGRADEMRREIAGMIVSGTDGSGMSGDEVIALYVAEKGEQIRIAPTATGFNLVAWLGPGILLLAAGIGLLFALRRWSRSHGARDGESEPPVNVDPDDPYVARVKKALEKYP